jgi:two-component system, cell cycle sensor histidine kinase and response regulator CckA
MRPWLHRLIPEGRPLPEAAWRRRHWGILALLWAHAAGLTIFGILAGSELSHALMESGLVAVMALLAGLTRLGRTFAEIMACLGLLTSSALLVHFSGGYIEMHFHFFVMVGLMALYQDWVPFLLAIAYVVVHHGLVGVLEPQSVFNHAAAWSNPWGWAALHGVFILGMSVVSLIAWRVSEAAHARGELILNSAGEGIVGVDGEGRTTFANTAAAAMTGWSVAELIGHPLGERVAPEGDAVPWGWSAANAPGRVTGETVFRRKDGTTFPVEYVGAPIEQRGTVAGAVVVFNDITQRKRADEALRETEQRLRQSQKMEAVGQLAGGIAHDFNNLLTVIIGRSDRVHRHIGPDSAFRDDLELITTTGMRAASLTRQLLAFSRNQMLQPEVLDLNVVVRNTTGMLRRLIGEHIRLDTVLPDSLGAVRADPAQVEQVIMNLVVNARDAMPDGGTVTIATADVRVDDGLVERSDLGAGPFVRLEVSDTGCGMDAGVQAHLFEPFFTTKAPGKGTGLGLATVYGIVKQHGGAIYVDSVVGKGTTFSIYLPRATGRLGVWSATAPTPERGRETILLVEDEAAVRDLAAEILLEYGYTVLTAVPDGALTLVARHPGDIHLLLTDVIMPQISGPVLAANVLRLRPETRVLFMSGYTDDAIVPKGVLDDPSRLLMKPFRAGELLAKVREILDRE